MTDIPVSEKIDKKNKKLESDLSLLQSVIGAKKDEILVLKKNLQDLNGKMMEVKIKYEDQIDEIKEEKTTLEN